MIRQVLIIFIITIAFAGKGFPQTGFEEWNRNYPKVNLEEVLKFEQQYADSIEANSGKAAYYTRVDKYRFSATYLGEKRKVDAQVMKSMKNVFKLFGGNSEQLDGLVENEYLFQIGEVKFWAPIQQQLEKPFNKEVKKGKGALLYCMFLNEHSSIGLHNTLLISEFAKE
ncbi:hypothetical protein [Pontibacter ruber]|uniref:Uncharacterized protein n=1 Tax=Pontibacter ruber TaxID=1343895 RepID=A0ABW5CVT0_9BACT|nr:hypothetical protein [Pontibacter ruber]